MIVSIVMPETGLRAVVAMALAATEAKKNEKTRVSRRPTMATTKLAPWSVVKKMPITTVDSTTPIRMVITGMSRSVRSWPASSPWRKALAAMANEPATMRSDLMMPKMPAVAMAPDADEPDVAAEDVDGVHRRDRHGAGIDRPGPAPPWPIIQISGTSTKLDRKPPAQRIIEERRPMT